MSSPRMATHHDPHRISLLIRRLRPSFARPSRRRALTTSPSASARLISVPIRSHASDSVPVTPICPPSRCACAAMPSGLDIDHKRQLNGTVPPYAQHVVVRTGRDDWGSKIEDDVGVEGTGMNFAKSLKGLVGRGGKLFDPERPILITNSSLPANADPNYTSVQVFPQHLHVPRIPHTPEAHEAFVSQFLNSKSDMSRKMGAKRILEGSEDGFDETGFPILIPEDLVAHKRKLNYTRNTSPTILICGHNSRDTRCGILGPLLRAEFNSYVGGRTQLPVDDERSTGFRFNGLQAVSQIGYTRVALTSHIGGHAFAGNVVIYLPKKFKMSSGKVSPLAGKGIWYGRVEPRHVWGIMEETVQRGRIIEELQRGIHEPGVGG